MRYIDADNFVEWLDVGHLRSPSEICYSEGDVKVMIDMQPTVDVVDKTKYDDLYTKYCELARLTNIELPKLMAMVESLRN